MCGTILRDTHPRISPENSEFVAVNRNRIRDACYNLKRRKKKLTAMSRRRFSGAFEISAVSKPVRAAYGMSQKQTSYLNCLCLVVVPMQQK